MLNSLALKPELLPDVLPLLPVYLCFGFDLLVGLPLLAPLSLLPLGFLHVAKVLVWVLLLVDEAVAG